MRQSLELLLDLVDDLEVVGTATNGLDAQTMSAQTAPDVVLMDLNMPIMGGVEATKLLLSDHPDIAVVVLTTFDDDESILQALRAGAIGYLTKDADHAHIAQAIRSAHLGQSVLDTDVQLRLLRLAEKTPDTTAGHIIGAPLTPIAPAVPSLLTKREKEILHLVGAGFRNGEIAMILSVAEATVKTHINNIFTKADLHSRSDAVRYALTVGPDAPEFRK
ncbi:LuxR family transcriptional regulator (plasmid) [Frondihabitans sp. PAMC 28766]|uniref:response regulator transcription factor n=1 Tax=Frondihabitans sp. PAMC 28766 TaxID=1795630 RepID=UPI00078ED1CF|nr:response regulator transcription factor [Frondihabitans sp. PAMC 28766]AMM22617.1 LuxR family transcriptional regulator [Frondihabitans sp. PAMC 28766]